MQPKKLKHYLRRYNGVNYDYYYIDTAGVIQTQTTKIELQYAPKGWIDNVISFKKHSKYKGTNINFTSPLEFVKDGAKILKFIYYDGGLNSELELLIEFFNEDSLVYDYDTDVAIDLDFAQFLDLPDESKVRINLLQKGFMSQLESRASVKYAVDLESNLDVKYIKVESVPLISKHKFTGIDQPNDGTTTPVFTQPDGVNMPTLLYINSEGYSNGDGDPKGNDHIGNFANCFQQGWISAISLSMANKWFFRNTSLVTSYPVVRVKGSITLATIAGTTDVFPRIRIFRAGHNTSTILQDIAAVDGATILAGNSATETLVIDELVALGTNECLWLSFFYDNTNMDTKFHIYDLSLDVSYLNFAPDSYVPTISLMELYSKLIEEISDATTIPSSTLLTASNMREVRVTSGDGLRMLKGAVIKTSFDSFWQSINSIQGTSMQYHDVADQVALEKTEDAFQNTQIVDIGVVSEFTVEPLKDDVFNALKIGFSNVRVTNDNGKEEYNIQHEYVGPIKKKLNDMDAVSDYNASMFDISLTSANLAEKTRASEDSDNDVFFIHADLSGVAGTFDLNGVTTNYYNLFKTPIDLTPASPTYWEIDNIFQDVDETTFVHQDKCFNIFFTPKRCVYRNGAYIHSLLLLDSASDLKLASASKTTNNGVMLITREGIVPTVIDESLDITISGLDTPLFQPFIIKCGARLPYNIVSLIRSNPLGYITTEWLGNTYSGYVLECQNNVSEYQKQDLILLPTVSTNMNNLM